MDTPIYDSVAADQGWSPDELGPAFDFEFFIQDSHLKVAAHQSLIRARDRDRDKEVAKVTQLRPKRP